MMNPYRISDTIEVEDTVLHVRCGGDYRMVLDCFAALKDADLDNEERVLSALIIFYEEFNSVEDVMTFPYVEQALTKMYEFFNCGKSESAEYKAPTRILIDWNKDAQLISAAVNKVAGKEVRAEECVHWWTFMGYYMSVGESSLSTIIGIRDKILRGKPLEKYEREFRAENPEYFDWDHDSMEEKEAKKWLQSVWGRKGE